MCKMDKVGNFTHYNNNTITIGAAEADPPQADRDGAKSLTGPRQIDDLRQNGLSTVQAEIVDPACRQAGLTAFARALQAHRRACVPRRLRRSKATPPRASSESVAGSGTGGKNTWQRFQMRRSLSIGSPFARVPVN